MVICHFFVGLFPPRFTPEPVATFACFLETGYVRRHIYLLKSDFFSPVSSTPVPLPFPGLRGRRPSSEIFILFMINNIIIIFLFLFCLGGGVPRPQRERAAACVPWGVNVLLFRGLFFYLGSLVAFSPGPPPPPRPAPLDLRRARVMDGPRWGRC